MVLEYLGYSVEAAHNARQALQLFDPAVHEVVITDNRMPGMSGEELAAEIKFKAPKTPVVIYSAWEVEDCSNVDAVLQKPSSMDEISETISRLIGAIESPPTKAGPTP